LVGLPGMGKRALSSAFIASHPAWTVATHRHESMSAPRCIATSDQPLGIEGEVVLRLGPMSDAEGCRYLAARLERLNVDALCDDAALNALVRRVGAVPSALEIAAELAAAQSVKILLSRLDDRSLLQLASRSTRALAWRAQLEQTLDSLSEADLRALIELSVFREAFDEEAARQVAVASLEGALSVFIELNLLETKGDAFRMMACIRGLAAERFESHDDAAKVRLRHAQWALEQGAHPRRFGRVAAELQSVLESNDATAARLAGTRIASWADDGGSLRPLLQRLLALDRELGEPSPETECAIARLRLVLGEPESTWRRIEPLIGRAGRFEGRANHLAANALRRLGRRDEAMAHYANAIAQFEASDEYGELGAVLGNFGGFLVELGRAKEARSTWSRALRCFAVHGDERSEAITLGDLGLLDHEAGQLEDAERRYSRALALHADHANTRFVGIVSGDLGELKLLLGSPLEAKALLARALEVLESVGDQRQAMLVGAVLALAESLTGESEAGRKRFDRLRDRAPADLHPVMSLYAAMLQLNTARDSRSAGRRDREREILAEVEGALDGPHDSPDEARRAAQLLRAELERHRRSAGWAIAHDASFVVIPGSALGTDEVRVDLSRQVLKRRLLKALLDARLAQPGDPLPQEKLLRAGWPDQRATATSARNRLHVALSGLRKLGLDGLLLSGPRGYMLDPDIELFVAE
ncbi:MAG: tetratricopeptide (TPR) repeat protein, partial [Polyangiales bacterium]